MDGTVCGLKYNGTAYYFYKNLQGDVIAITDETGAVVAKYSYDAWGKCTISEDNSGVGIAEINPFRYRDYYYDQETGLYYLQSRYYDPEIGRFINADNVETIVGVSGFSLAGFQYCENCPVVLTDIHGESPVSVFLNILNISPTVRAFTFLLGFSWDFRQGIWYSRMYPLQRLFGYCDLYDNLAPFVGIFITHKKMPFFYKKKQWMLWLWKGQYGITIGAEVGLYVYSPKSLYENVSNQKWYRCAYDSERIKMSFTLYKNGQKLFTRPYQNHWWLTGFKLGTLRRSDVLSMQITLGFKSSEMAHAFCKNNGVKYLGNSKVSFWW